MIIANPIYDVVFKRLMENERVAKFFISTLLDETVVDLQIKPQERTIFPKLEDMDEVMLASLEKQLYERLSISVFRVDFVATVKTDVGEHKKVMIEIQKAKNALDLMRFRTYLAEHYKMGILKEYNFSIINEVVHEMVSILQHAGADAKMRKAIEDEHEAYRLLEVMAENRRKELEKIIHEKDETIKKKDETIAELLAKVAELENKQQKN